MGRSGDDEVVTGVWMGRRYGDVIFFFNDTATTEIYTLSLHDALPIYPGVLLPIHKVRTGARA